MRIHDLSPLERSRKNRKRVGRGVGSGHGRTSCRGHKGQKARSGGTIVPGFEGGQMPIQRRLPKRGFTNVFRKEIAVVNLKDLNRFEASAVVDLEALKSAGLVRKAEGGSESPRKRRSRSSPHGEGGPGQQDGERKNRIG